MASQVEIASSAPFGCVLKDHNRRDRCGRENNARANAAVTHAAFQKNLKELVRDHLQISISSASSSDENLPSHVNNNNNNNNSNASHHIRQHLRCLTNQQSANITSKNDNNVDDLSAISCRQARILDRWAAKQAQEMVSSIENQNQKAEVLIQSEKSSSSAKENSISHDSKPQTSSNASNLGASSLVQIWEARLNKPEPKMDRSNSSKSNSNSAAASSRTNSTSGCNDIVTTSVEEPSRNSDITDSAANDEALADWESAGQSSRSSVNFASSDAGESERVRIADIIKRLTCDSSDHEQGSGGGDPPSRRHSYGSDQSDIKAISQVVNSPIIRGRQAFNELLAHMEQERSRELEALTERQSVSRFPQRGRIQSMLRLRFMQRCVAIQDQQRTQSIRSTLFECTRSHQRLTNIHTSANGVVDHATSSTSDGAKPTTAKKTPNDPPTNANPCTVNPLIQENHRQENSTVEQQAVPPAENTSSNVSEVQEEDVHEEASSSSDVTWQGESLEGENFDVGEAFGSRQSLNNWDENEMDDEEEIENQQGYGDWFADIARPRRYWEDQRQAWYQEMLTTSAENNEIRQLLERKTVSGFLASDFRGRMDRLMETHVQRQVNLEVEQLDEESQERMGQLILSFFQRHSRSAGIQQEDERDEAEEEEDEEEVEEEEADERQEEEEEEEEESPPSGDTLSPFRSWNYNDSSLPSQSSTQHRQDLASPNHPSLEMELIYDLRGRMEEMQREMSELRKSMQACMDMQAELQNPQKQDAHPVQEASKISIDMLTKKRTCCICYEMRVDSFLYRCGHMCTCLKCAHELQWSSGKCPICRAPILDVVRAYVDS